MKIEDFPYKTIFAANLSKISDTELDVCLAKADLEQLKPLMPKDIDLIKNKDLIGCVVNVAVAGRVNANGDSITNKSAIKIAKNFIYKYVNIGHKSNLIKGSIVNYGFSKFGTDALMTEEEAASSNDPFNISVAFVLWKNALTNDFIQLLEKSVDSSSDKYKCISASWELLFKDYDIAVGNKNINESELVTSKAEKDSLEKYLKANGGSGKKDEKMIYRVIKGEDENDFLVPAGIGLVENPAADVKGLEIVTAEKETIIPISISVRLTEDKDKADIVFKENEISEALIVTAKISPSCPETKIILNAFIENDQTNFTNERKGVTIIDINQNNNLMDKKITKIEDINDELLKQANASAEVIRFFNEKIQEENVKFVDEQNKNKNTEKSLADTQKELSEVKENLRKLQEEVQKAAAQELYTQRMSHFDDTYELSPDERKLIAQEIQNATDEVFASTKDKYAILLKDKNKETIAAKKKQMKEEEEAKESKKHEEGECGTNKKKASNANEDGKGNEAIDAALESGKDANAKIPNAAIPEVSFADKFAAAFSVEKCVEIRQ